MRCPRLRLSSSRTTAPSCCGTIALSRLIREAGSGGLGAVSTGFTDIFPVALIASLALNVLLAKFARRAGGAASTLHRAHSIALACLLVYVVLLVLVLTFSLLPTQWFATALLIIATIVGKV